MKIASLIFIIMVFMIVFKYTKVFNINLLIIIGVFCLWFAIVYIQVHLKNQDRNTPRSVYLTTKFLFIAFVSLLLINNVMASVDILKPASVNQSYAILQTCSSCTSVNITISNVEGIVTSNQEMVDNGSGVWVYDITPSVISRHDVTGEGDLDGVSTSFTTYFEVTPSGKISSTGDSVLYSLFSLILFGIIFLLTFFIFTMPSGNEKDERGFENKVIKVKYFRIFFIALTYSLIILLLNFLNGLAVNFSALSLFAGILGFGFEIMLRLAWPFTVIMIAWIIVMLVHDTNLGKQLKKFENMRLFQDG